MSNFAWDKNQSHMSNRHLFRATLLLAAILLSLLGLAGCSTLGGDDATLSGKIRISGSTALLPFAQQAAQDFKKLHPQVTLDVQGGGSFVGLDQMYSGQVDIGDSDVYADPTRYPDPDITDHLVAVVPFAMIVHSDIILSSLTQDDIVNIYTGKIKNWRDLGGPDEVITVVFPRSDFWLTRHVPEIYSQRRR